MLNLITAGATYLFPGGRALKLVKNGINISNSTNPLILTKNITLTVVDCCTPPCTFSSSLCGSWSRNRSFGGEPKSSDNRFRYSFSFRNL